MNTRTVLPKSEDELDDGVIHQLPTAGEVEAPELVLVEGQVLHALPGDPMTIGQDQPMTNETTKNGTIF